MPRKSRSSYARRFQKGFNSTPAWAKAVSAWLGLDNGDKKKKRVPTRVRGGSREHYSSDGAENETEHVMNNYGRNQSP